ncbi:hypothetical protein RSK20926_09744 [Roseobacter sp. SK209-2-6]|nr:hypothetical protein RSK20926_09744 [Roseobacter sp. SK209-2-6]
MQWKGPVGPFFSCAGTLAPEENHPPERCFLLQGEAIAQGWKKVLDRCLYRGIVEFVNEFD